MVKILGSGFRNTPGGSTSPIPNTRIRIPRATSKADAVQCTSPLLCAAVCFPLRCATPVSCLVLRFFSLLITNYGRSRERQQFVRLLFMLRQASCTADSLCEAIEDHFRQICSSQILFMCSCVRTCFREANRVADTSPAESHSNQPKKISAPKAMCKLSISCQEATRPLAPRATHWVRVALRLNSPSSFFIPIHSNVAMVDGTFGLTPTSPSSSGADLGPGALKGDTLLLPTVSVGSVPQLAFDLLVHAPELGLLRTARVSASKWCVPFSGPLDSLGTVPSPTDITSALELHRSPTQKVTLLHQRSPVLKSQKDAFITALLDWVEKQEFSQILVVTSLDAGLRVDPEFSTPLLHWAPAHQEVSSGLVQFVTSRTPQFHPVPLPSFNNAASKDPSTTPRLPGSGLARRILDAAQKRRLATPLAALLLFAGDGDNRGDAHALAGFISTGLGVQGKEGMSHISVSSFYSDQALTQRSQILEFSEPASWQSLFGSRFDQSLYG